MNLNIITNAFNSTIEELDPFLNYQETVYQETMLYFLRKSFEESQLTSEEVIPYKLSSGYVVGFGRADIVVRTNDHVFILELKRGKTNVFTASQQIKRYLKHFTCDGKQKIGLLLVFNLTPLFKKFK